MIAGQEATVVIDLLASIDATLKAMLALAQKRVQASQPKPVASDRDLDSKYGDPVLKFKPRDWMGEDYRNCPFSQCPPELLDLVADSLDYFATKAEQEDRRTSGGKPVAEFNRKDAARARGWAKRHRDRGFTPGAPAPTTSGEASGWDGDPTPEGWR